MRATLMKWFFFLLTVPKRSISLKDYGQNDVYFKEIQFELEEEPPMLVDRNRKKPMENGFEQQNYPQRVVSKRGNNLSGF